jgi:UTP-glucose-1-phosphate uridylyltransferase
MRTSIRTFISLRPSPPKERSVTKNPIHSAVVLAAGRGTRMGEITSTTPKPMLPVGGRPMLEHILGRLEAAGVERFFIVTGYRREMIEQHFSGWHLPVEFRLQEREQRRQRELEEVRQPVGDADQPDDLHVAAERAWA